MRTISQSLTVSAGLIFAGFAYGDTPLPDVSWINQLDPLPTGEWRFAVAGAADTSVYYLSRRHQLRNGDKLTVWVRMESKITITETGIQYRSQVARIIFDCAQNTTQTLATTFYRDNNLAGGVTYSSDTPGPLDHTVPGTVFDFVSGLVCGTK